MLLTLAAFVVVLGVLIFVHELGHFVTAKWVGIAVPRFSIGLGPVTPFSFRRGETEYVISWIPFGGYVKMATREDGEGVDALEGGEAPEEYPPDKLFESKPLWARILVITAGVIMNMLFAWVVYIFLGSVYGRVEDPTTVFAGVIEENLPAGASALEGLPRGTQIIRVNGDTVASYEEIGGHFADITTDQLRIEFAGGVAPVTLEIEGLNTDDRAAAFLALIPLRDARIGSVQPGSAADRAGMEPGDLVLRIDGDTALGWPGMVDVIRASPERELELDVLRDDETVTLAVVPASTTSRDSVTGEEEEIGQLGVTNLIPTRRVRVGLVGAVGYGLRRVGQDTRNIGFVLTRMFTGRISPRELGGPVLIGQLSGQAARLGLEVFLSFMALFSVNLAILNILPIPVLDGGHLVFLLLEGVRGRPLSLALRMRLTQFGLAVLLGIMALVFTNDILRVVFGI